jgi:microcompartment protein CcmK/EutM
MAEMAGKVGAYFVEISVADGAFCAGPQELVCIYAGSSSRLLFSQPEQAMDEW